MEFSHPQPISEGGLMALAENPRGSTVRSDDQGSYVAYHRICKNCQIELTSRNRAADGSLKCKSCSTADWNSIYGGLGSAPRYQRKPNADGTIPDRLPAESRPVKRPAIKPALDSTAMSAVVPASVIDQTRAAALRADLISRADRQAESHHTVSPERQRVHALLTKFLLYPTIKTAKDDLLAGLVDYEINERIRFL